jgi:lysine N6-hydroxylase
MTETIHDFAAIGVGPFNLGLACLTEPVPELNGIFLDENEGFDWHPGMLLEHATLQTPFMADLVTMADPTNRFSFLNYAKQQGHLYSFYIREDFFVLRTEFNQYCQWAAAQLPNIHFNRRVEWVDYDDEAACYRVQAVDPRDGSRHQYLALRLVLGTGTSPRWPEAVEPIADSAVHSAHYLDHRDALQSRDVITVVGSGQSAAEVVYDLLQDIDHHGYALHWITRSPRFMPLEYSKLTLEMTSPEYVDYFYALPESQRDALVAEQQTLYKGIDDGLIAEIRDTIYTKRTHHAIQVGLRTNSALEAAERDPATGRLALTFRHREQDRRYTHVTDGLVLATGYAHQLPGFIQGIASRLRWDDQGRFDVRRDYSVDHDGDEVFVQNAELHTHGFISPDLGMGSYRNACIINQMAGRECYPVEKRIAFQTFGVPEAGAPAEASARDTTDHLNQREAS